MTALTRDLAGVWLLTRGSSVHYDSEFSQIFTTRVRPRASLTAKPSRGASHPGLHRNRRSPGCRLHCEARASPHPPPCTVYFIPYTSGLGLFELRGRILRGKRPPDQQAACGVGQGKRAPPPGALCGAPGTLQPNNRPRQRCPGIARGRPVAARRRRAMRPCTCMRWTRACALLTRGSAGSAAT